MFVPSKFSDKSKQPTGKKLAFFSRSAFVLCALVLALAVFVASGRLPFAAHAASPALPENARATEAAQVPATATASASASRLAAIPSIWPAKGAVTSGFGWRNDPFGGGNELHAGLDIANAIGTPVVATADGQVVQSGLVGEYGNMVQIDHGNGIATIYGHNSQLAVSVGQTVKKGQIISYVGSTGKSTGPHLHYEVRENGTATDPWKYLVSSR